MKIFHIYLFLKWIFKKYTFCLGLWGDLNNGCGRQGLFSQCSEDKYFSEFICSKWKIKAGIFSLGMHANSLPHFSTSAFFLTKHHLGKASLEPRGWQRWRETGSSLRKEHHSPGGRGMSPSIIEGLKDAQRREYDYVKGHGSRWDKSKVVAI